MLHLHWSPNQNFPTFTLKRQLNVETYSNPMDPMGMAICFPSSKFGWRRGCLSYQVRCRAKAVLTCGWSRVFPASVIQSSVIIDFLQVPCFSEDFTKVREQRTDFLRCKHTVQLVGPYWPKKPGLRVVSGGAQPQDILPADGRRL